MQDFEGLSAEVRELEQRNLALEADLWSKEAELNRIKCVPACLSSGVQAQRALFERPQRYLKKLVRGAYNSFTNHLISLTLDQTRCQCSNMHWSSSPNPRIGGSDPDLYRVHFKSMQG